MSDAPRALPDPGVVAGWKLIAAVVGFSAFWGVAVAGALYRLLSWWEQR